MLGQMPWKRPYRYSPMFAGAAQGWRIVPHPCFTVSQQPGVHFGKARMRISNRSVQNLRDVHELSCMLHHIVPLSSHPPTNPLLPTARMKQPTHPRGSGSVPSWTALTDPDHIEGHEASKNPSQPPYAAFGRPRARMEARATRHRGALRHGQWVRRAAQ
ncbi:hypothetical protein BD414DRAFT_497239 [Trametes punicea]|nr:hypothetical protein BD414DRAFT_497239 [Trametes punicea]